MTPELLLSIFKYMLYAGTALVAVATIGTSIYTGRVSASKDRKIDTLLEGTKQLQAGNKELLTKVADYQANLEKMQRENESLKEEVAKTSQGRYSAWDFNGVRREGRPGQMNAHMGEEFGIFNQLVAAEKQRDYETIIRMSTQQIAKTPGWLTPYLFRGVALINLGRSSKAISDLEFVVRNAHGDSQYAKAAEHLERLRADSDK
ncbi:MAG: hypothetical protein ACREAA_16300 [Candidatus Polarisedimenticolia bacterium]